MLTVESLFDQKKPVDLVKVEAALQNLQNVLEGATGIFYLGEPKDWFIAVGHPVNNE